MRPLLASLLLAASAALAENPTAVTSTPIGPYEVRVHRMDMGKASSTSIAMSSFEENTVFQKDPMVSLRNLSRTLADNEKEKITRVISTADGNAGLCVVMTTPRGTRDYQMSVFGPDGKLRGTVVRKFPAGKMEQTAFDAEGKLIPESQQGQIFSVKPPEPVDLTKVTLLKMPADGDTPAASPLPQCPNEIRTEYYDYGDLILQAIYTPDLRQESFFAKDSKALEFRTVTATLSDTDAERVTQSFHLKNNIVTCDQSWRLNKKTNEVTESCYTPKGKLIYTRHTIPGKSETIVDEAGNTITRSDAVRLLYSPNPDQIDLDKVPVQSLQPNPQGTP